MENNNLDLWERVGKTNPSHTKEVKLGRTITAIDPYRQIEAATREFGPITVGWGYEVRSTIFTTTDECCVIIRLWTKSKDNYLEHGGQNGLYIDNAKQKADKDFLKKAITDGVTKCLSLLGFNNDIFLGKWDDNKYVQQRKNEEAKNAWHGPLGKTKLKGATREYNLKVNKATTTNELKELNDEYSDVLKQTRLDDPITLDGDGVDHKGLGAEYKAKFQSLKLIEDQLQQPKDI